jgi:hypothetical protein
MKEASRNVLIVAAAALYILLILAGGLARGSTDGSSVVLVTDRAFYSSWWPLGFTLENHGVSTVWFGLHASFEVNVFGLWIPGFSMDSFYGRPIIDILIGVPPGGSYPQKAQATGFLLPGLYRVARAVDYPNQTRAYGYFYVTDSLSYYVLFVLFIWKKWRPTKNKVELFYRLFWVCGLFFLVWSILYFIF